MPLSERRPGNDPGVPHTPAHIQAPPPGDPNNQRVWDERRTEMSFDTFETEVHMQYQQMGSMLRNTVTNLSTQCGQPSVPSLFAQGGLYGIQIK